MSHILFCSNPFSGHVRPGLPIATELVARGHEVSWYTGSRFARLVESTGARHVPLDRAPDFDEADLGATFPERDGQCCERLHCRSGLRHERHRHWWRRRRGQRPGG